MDNKETEKIIEDLKKVGVEVFKSPRGYYTIKTKRFDSKLELIKECQRLILDNDYSVLCTKKIGDFMKENLETNKEWYENHKEDIKKIHEEAFAKLKQEERDALGENKR